jgi:hypothetical protein
MQEFHLDYYIPSNHVDWEAYESKSIFSRSRENQRTELLQEREERRVFQDNSWLESS